MKTKAPGEVHVFVCATVEMLDKCVGFVKSLENPSKNGVGKKKA